MNNKILVLSILSLLLYAAAFCGCSENEDTLPPIGGSRLTVHVTAGGFTSSDGIDTRAKEEDYKTTFIDGDAIGVYAVKSGNVMADCKNLQLTYKGGEWQGEDIYYYKDAKYFAYYPYKEELNDKEIKEVSDIVTHFKNSVLANADQSNYEGYSTCDLIAGDATLTNDNKTLNFNFQHQMAMLEISLPSITYELTDSENNSLSNYSIPVSGVKFNIGEKEVQFWNMEKSVYRYIISGDESNVSVSGEFLVGDKTIEYKKDNLSLSSGKYKRLEVKYDIEPIEHTLQIGDFFMKDGSLVGKDETLTDEQKKNCIGIVYWVGDATEDAQILGAAYPEGCTHGLVVALKGNDQISWQSTASSYKKTVSSWLEEKRKADDTFLQGCIELTTGMEDEDNLQKILGYNHSLVLEAFNEENPSNKVNAMEKVVEYRESVSAPANTSDWYLPSAKELSLLCAGESESNITGYLGTEICNQINIQLEKLNDFAKKLETEISNWPYYWSSSDDSEDLAFVVVFNLDDGGAYIYDKYDDYDRVRPVLAF